MARGFDGVDDTIDCGVITALQSATKATYVAWFYRSATNTTVGAGSVARGAGNVFSRFSFVWFSDSVFYVVVDTDATNTVYGAFTKAETGWHNILIQFDGTQSTNATKLVVYYDGVAQTLTYPNGNMPTALAATQGTWAFGRDNWSGGSGRFWGGRIAECVLWTGEVFTAAEVAAISRGVHAYRMRRSSVKGYWPLRGLHSVEPDLSNNGFQGTLTGTTHENHAPVNLATRKSSVMFGAAAAGTAVPVFYNHLQTQGIA